MVTTQNESQDNAAALQAGVNAILNKPFNEKALRNAMQAQLGRSVCPMAVEPFAQSCAPDRAGARSR
jgi:DNA-binding response OmpR family regulator